MSRNRNFLPSHPTIMKKVTQSPSSFKNSKLLNKASSEFNEEIIDALLGKQKYEVEALRNKLEELTQKNELLSSTLSYYDNEPQKKDINERIHQAKIEEADILGKIQNCEKVEATTTSEEYYLWQKKKKIDEYNRKVIEIQQENHKEREEMRELRDQYKQRIMLEKEEIQHMLLEIERVQTENNYEDDLDVGEVVSPERMSSLKEEYESLVATNSILKENNEILTNQLEEGIKSMQVVLKKSFENSRSGLLRELQTIKNQIQNSQPTFPREISIGPTSAAAMEQYQVKLHEVQNLLSAEQAEQASNIIRPFDWQNLRWQQFLESENDDEVDYMERFEALTAEHQRYQRELETMEREMQALINESVSLTQKNMEVESATINLVKILQFGKK